MDGWMDGWMDGRLITFGVVHGILRRIHCYPVCIKNSISKSAFNTFSPNSSLLAAKGNQPPATTTTQAATATLVHEIQDLMDGEHTADELCCRFLKSFQELDELATTDDTQVVHLYK